MSRARMRSRARRRAERRRRANDEEEGGRVRWEPAAGSDGVRPRPGDALLARAVAATLRRDFAREDAGGARGWASGGFAGVRGGGESGEAPAASASSEETRARVHRDSRARTRPRRTSCVHVFVPRARRRASRR